MAIVVGPGIEIGPGINITREVGPGMDPTGISNATVVAQSPFAGGGNSYSFTGSGTNSYVYYAGSSAVAFGTGDYTVEWFQYETDSNAFPRPFFYGPSNSSTNYLALSFEGASTTAAAYYWPAVTSLVTLTKTAYKNQWSHFALVRISGKVYLYLNGTVQNAGGYTDGTNITNTTGNWYIGSKGTAGVSGEAFGGYITNHRVCKGVGVYTGNFTVPTTPLQLTQSAGTNISAITAGQCSILMAP